MRNLKPHVLPALKVTLIYAVVGGLWILFSDAALETLVPDPETQASLQTWKGWFYVLVTALLLFGLVLRQLHSSSRTARALRDQKDAFKLVFDKLPLAVHGYDQKGRVIFWNQGCTEAYGYEASDVLAKPMTEFLLSELDMCDRHAPSTMAGNETVMRCGVLTIIRKNGTLTRVHSTRLRLPLLGGHNLYFLDIPASKEAEAGPPQASGD